MTRGVWVYGPQGCGKSNHAGALARHFGLGRVCEADDWDLYGSTLEGRLVLAVEPPPPHVTRRVVVLTFEQAMQAARLVPAKRRKS